MDGKSEKAAVTMPPPCQTPLSLEARHSSPNPEAAPEMANYLQGWPLHTLSLALVFALPLTERLLAELPMSKAVSCPLSCEPRSVHR